MHAVQTMEAGYDIDQQKHSLLPWVTCFFGSLFFFYEFIQMCMPNAISSGAMHAFGLDATEYGVLSSIYFSANVIFLIPAGLILDRFSTRTVMLVSMAVCILGTFLFSQATSASTAIFYRFLTGIGSGFCFLSNVRLASRWFPPKRLALVTGLIVTMAMIGGMTAQRPLTAVVNAVGWRNAIVIDGMLGIGIFLLIAFFVKDYPSHMREQQEKDHKHLQQFGLMKSLKMAFLKPRNWFCGLYTSTMNLPLIVLGGMAGGMFLKNVDGLNATQSSWVTFMLFFGTMIGSPFMGWLSDRLERRKAPMLVGAVLSLIIMTAIVTMPHLSTATLMILFCLLGFITSTQVISYPTVAESNPPMLIASCVSVVSILTMGGVGIADNVFGKLVDYHWSGAMLHGERLYTSGDFTFAMWLFPICFCLSFLVACFVPETHCKNEYI